MKSIKASELDNLSNINLIDIRSHSRYIEGTIQSAINIEANNLINSPARYLTFDKTYYIFCEYGNTSKNVCYVLNKYGYDVINIIGGFSAYKKR